MEDITYTLTVDSGNPDEPDTRRFSSFASALGAYKSLDEKWKPFAWVHEVTDVGVNVVMKDGKVVAG